jgi:MoxR-like ATPase
MAPLVLAHRVIVTPDAELEGASGTAVVADALDKVAFKTPRR